MFRIPRQISKSVLHTQDADVMSIPYRKANRQASLRNLGSRSYSSEPDLTSRGVSRSRSSSNQSVSESTWEERISRSTGRTYWSVAQRQFHCTPRLLVISRPSTHCNVWDLICSRTHYANPFSSPDSLCKSDSCANHRINVQLGTSSWTKPTCFRTESSSSESATPASGVMRD